MYSYGLTRVVNISIHNAQMIVPPTSNAAYEAVEATESAINAHGSV